MVNKDRKFFKQIVHILILSEDAPLHHSSLSDIDYAITYGPCSGSVEEVERTEIDRKEAVELLKFQGTDPEFFLLDENGDDIE